MKMDYQNGKIYTIRTHKSDEFYIGSTTQPLTKRLSKHKTDYKEWKTGKRGYTTSFKIIENGDAYIELLEECPCENKMLLQKREGELIRANNCVNKIIPGRTKKEYHENNKDKISEKKKEYYEKNKDTIKEYYEKNKDTISEKGKKLIQCECGSVLRKSDILRHKKSKKHKQFQSIYDFIYG